MSINANELWTRYQFINLEVPSPSNVNTLYEDHLGQIWVGTDSGLYRIHNNKIQKVNHAPKSTFEDILRAGRNDIWLATNDGVWRWYSKTNNFTQFNCPDEQSFSQLTEHPYLGLIGLARSGLYQFTENKACRKIEFDRLPEDSLIERIGMFNQRLIFAVRGHGLFQCSAECNQIQAFASSIADTRVREIAATQNHLYIGTHKHGFYALNDQGKVKQHWHRNADTEPDNLTLPVNGVMALLPTEQTIWAGLWAGGLQQFDTESGKKISSSRFYAPDTSTIGGRHVRALLKSKNGTFYAGHENGVSIISPAYNQQGWIGLANDYQTGFSHDYISSLYRHSNAWFTGTSSGGLYRIDQTANTLLRLSPDSPSPFNLPTKSIWQISHSQRGDLLLGTANGVIRLNPNTLDWQPFGDTSKLTSADVYRLTEASDQTLWLSLWEGGIARLDQDGQLIGQWSRDDGLQQNTSVAITSTADNNVFVLNDAGLFLFDSEQDKFVNTDLQSPQNNCAEIEHVSTNLAGQLWALCQHTSLWHLKEGLWVNAELPTSEPILHIFSSLDGYQPKGEQLFLLSQEHIFALDINGQLIWKKPRLPIPDTTNIKQAAVVNNELVIATNLGLYRQKLSQSYHKAPSVAPIITGVRLFNKPWTITDTESKTIQLNDNRALYQGQLQLNYDQDLITFEFALPGYHHESIQGFSYRLFPFNKRWLNTAEDEARASYTRLPPGRYRFEVKAIDSSELPNSTFHIEVLPPWYLTWWAKTLTIFVLVVSVIAIIIGRTRRLKQSNLWLQESVKARTAELEQANVKLQQAANLDALTGLLNRRGFRNLCDPSWVHWQGNAVLMIADIDHFKQVNDQYGHQLGDEVLITCAKRLKSKAGENDLIARWGGEEFLILLRDDPKSSFNNLQFRAQQLQKTISASVMELSSENITVTMTAGVCEHNGQHFDMCLQQADQKLYEGKNSGRNKLII
ncbi:MAG: diguanylate cyclase [Thalassotalea sp.]|nr:diguanylate cyclase [Thalassotalea sp.]